MLIVVAKWLDSYNTSENTYG